MKNNVILYNTASNLSLVERKTYQIIAYLKLISDICCLFELGLYNDFVPPNVPPSSKKAEEKQT